QQESPARRRHKTQMAREFSRLPYGAGPGGRPVRRTPSRVHHAGDLPPSLTTSTVPLLRKSSPPVFEPAVSTTSRARCFTTGKPASLLSRVAKSGISEDIAAPRFLLWPPPEVRSGCEHRSKVADRLFDQLVGATGQRNRNRDAELLRGLQINDQLDFGGLLHRQIGWLFTLKDSAGIMTG